MLNIYIIEEDSLKSQGPPSTCITNRLNTGGDISKYVKSYLSFSDENVFRKCILSTVKEILLTDSISINLLIISAHGIDETGTNLWTQNNSINLREYQDYFKILPAHLVIYMRSCKAAFPGAFWSFYKKSNIKPILIGPIVSIYENDANDLQHIIIDTILINSDNESCLKNEIDQFNLKVKNIYNRKYSIGMFLRSEEWYPEQGVLY